MTSPNDNLENLVIKPAYEADDGPLTDEYMEFLRKKAAESMPKGILIKTESLFNKDFLKKSK